MAEIVNLRAKRKQKKRLGKETLAEENRVRFGRTKAQKIGEEIAKLRSDRQLDGHKRGE